MKNMSILMGVLLLIIYSCNICYSEPELNYTAWKGAPDRDRKIIVRVFSEGFFHGMMTIRDRVVIANDSNCEKAINNEMDMYYANIENSNINTQMVISGIDKIYLEPKYRKVSVYWLIRYIYEYYFNNNYTQQEKKEILNPISEDILNGQ